ncbi:MAG: DUF4417 domain-containing protein [Ruminococcaceae bacterium]|nr:DUF4417 domain-containing protein [Oscillospiraceae bacterium]
MTEENYNYRTSPMFLRNQFKGEGKWNIPVISKVDLGLTPFDDQRLIGFDKIKTGKDEHYERIVHFFLYDYKFEDIWTKPDKYIDMLKKYKAVLSPDYSMYIEMNPVMQLYNTFRNRWVGAYLAEKGIKVIPTVSWGLENTFDFCFNGIEKGSTVAVSTYMVSEHGSHKDQKEFFLKGYNEMLKRIEPELVICYNTPFPEMEGNILFVDYDLSSWQHYGDDIGKSANTVFVEKFGAITNNSISENSKKKQIYGFVMPECFKGMGSAYGGKWQPKNELAERFLGKPGEIKRTSMPGKKGGYIAETKIGEDGRAVKERHYTTHDRTNHTNPHDHIFSWDPITGKPNPQHQIINYPEGSDVPEFKFRKDIDMSYISEELLKELEKKYPGEKINIITSCDNFDTISDFKWCINGGAEVEFCWKDIDYTITWFNGKVGICQVGHNETDREYDTVDELLTYKLATGETLKEVITQVEVTSRTL